jgi:hypothetical protein
LPPRDSLMRSSSSRSPVPTVDGWIWRHEWEAVGEGQYTVAAKFFLANAVRLPIASRWPGTSSRPTAWEQTLGYKRLRYCRRCMSSGYQAAVCQIVGLEVCPIHGDPLLMHCSDCGAPSPFFDPRTPPRYLSFRCMNCARPFGFADVEDRLAAWRPPDGVERLRPEQVVYGWLRDLPPPHRVWFNLENWGTTQLLEDSVDRSRAVLGVLERVFSTAPPALNASDAAVIGPYVLSSSHPRGAVEFGAATFEAIRNRLLPQLDVKAWRNHICVPSFDVPVPTSAKVPPEAHAAAIWTAQRETDPNVRRTYAGVATHRASWSERFLCLQNYHARGIPQTLSAPILEAAWEAALRIAQAWHFQLTELARGGSSEEAVALLATTPHWAARLGRWSEAQYSPVGLIAFRESRGSWASAWRSYLVVV